MDKIENAYSRCVLRLRPSQKYTKIKEVHYNAEYYRCIKISNDDDEDINARKLYQYFSGLFSGITYHQYDGYVLAFDNLFDNWDGYRHKYDYNPNYQLYISNDTTYVYKFKRIDLIISGINKLQSLCCPNTYKTRINIDNKLTFVLKNYFTSVSNRYNAYKNYHINKKLFNEAQHKLVCN